MLGLQTITPSIENLLTKLKTASQWANQLSINSCDAGAAIVGGLALTNQTLSKKYCETSGMQSGMFSDMVAARHQCNRVETRQATAKAATQHRDFADILDGENFNVAWRAINKHPYLSKQSKELKQFYMSLSGTLIANQGKHFTLPGMGKTMLLPIVMAGGTANIYGCNDEECLNVTQSAGLTIREEDSMVGKANRLLHALALSIKRDIPLTPSNSVQEGSVSFEEAKAFLESTSLPIYRMLNVTMALSRGTAPLNISSYSEVIAWDILYQYFQEITEAILEGAKTLNQAQFEKTVVGDFMDTLMNIKKDIGIERAKLAQKIQIKTKLVDEVRAMEQQLAGNIDLSNNL